VVNRGISLLIRMSMRYSNLGKCQTVKSLIYSMMIYDVYIHSYTHMQQTEEEFSAAVRLYGNERLSQTSAPSNCHRTIDSLSLYSPLSL
jgi:hypothetical protein